VVVAALAVLTTGCFRIDMRVDVNDDGSGVVQVETAVQPDKLDAFGGLLGDFGDPGNEAAEAPSREELCADFLDDQDIPPEADIETFDDGDFCGARYTQTFVPDTLGAALGADGDFVLERDGDGWRFEAVTTDDQEANDPEFLALFESVLEDAEFVLRVRLPGRQVEHNADRIDPDGALVWDLDIFDPPDRLFARTVPGEPITGSGEGSSSTVGLVALGVVAGLVVVVGAYLLGRRSRKIGPKDGQVSDESRSAQ
jgi:hypothetical protein